jgi:LysR family transcriptional regulator, low CO2-responsive transcriptional regulator
MNYTLNQLRIYLKVVQKESITKAAEELFLTQPAVSIQLKNFQEQFDIPLTEIVNKRLYVTDFGREIAIAAENILNEVQQINHKTSAYKGRLSGRLKISVVSTGKYVIPYLLTDFVRNNEDIELNISVSNKARVNLSLEKNEVDFALMSVIPENFKLETLRLMKNKLYFVGKDNVDNMFKSHGVQALEKLPLLYREDGSATRAEMERYITNHKLKPNKRLELSSNESLKQMMIAGLGYSIMPLIGLKNELDSGQLTITPIPGLPITTNWHLVWLPEKKMSPVAKAFLEHVEKNKDAIIKSNFGWFEEY